MRVATFNVQRGTPSAGAREAGLSAGDALEAAATELSELGLDVLALQEVDEPLRGLAPSAYRSLSAASNLANRRFAPARRLLTAFAAALRGRRRSGYGIALATRLSVLSWKVLRLPSWKSPIRRDLSGERGVAGRYIRFEEQRMAIVAALDAGRPLLVCATHLAPNSALNSRQLAWLERRLPRIARRRGIRGAPILVLGDLNMDVEKVRRESGLGVLAEGLTYPEDAPDAQIDHVLGWGMVPGGEASVVHLPVSDHAGLVADVEFE